MNDKPQTDLSKHVARVIRSMQRRKSTHGDSVAGVCDSTPKEAELESLSSSEVGSSHMDAEGYPAWLRQL